MLQARRMKCRSFPLAFLAVVAPVMATIAAEERAGANASHPTGAAISLFDGKTFNGWEGNTNRTWRNRGFCAVRASGSVLISSLRARDSPCSRDRLRRKKSARPQDSKGHPFEIARRGRDWK